MKSETTILVLVFTALLSCDSIASAQSGMSIRNQLGGIEFDDRQDLIRMGDKAFPAFEIILNDPEAKVGEIIRILGLLSDVEADRSRFLEHAVRRTADPIPQIRSRAAKLLGKIGTIAEASPLVALLSDPDVVVVNFAATALAEIGGPRELVAMDVWLQGTTHIVHSSLYDKVKMRRTELVERLARRPLPKK